MSTPGYGCCADAWCGGQACGGCCRDLGYCQTASERGEVAREDGITRSRYLAFAALFDEVAELPSPLGAWRDLTSPAGIAGVIERFDARVGFALEELRLAALDAATTCRGYANDPGLAGAA